MGTRHTTYRLYNMNTQEPWKDLMDHPELMAIVSKPIRGTVKQRTSLVFERGTQQSMHFDTWYHLGAQTPGQMVAAWIALDDVTPENGPLVYIPRSHMIETMLTNPKAADFKKQRAFEKGTTMKDY